MDERSFTAGRTADLLDVKLNTLNAWRKKGYLPLPEQVRSAWTRFTLDELLITAVMVELIRLGIITGVASEFARGVGPSLNNVAKYAGRAKLPGPLWLTIRRDGDGHKIDAFESMEQLEASGAETLLMIDVAAIVLRTLERIVREDNARKNAEADAQLCDECLAEVQLFGMTILYCDHNQTTAMILCDENGLLVDWFARGGVTREQAEAAASRYLASRETLQ